MHIGQAKVSPSKAISQSLVIQPQLMQHRGVEVVQMHFVLNGEISKIIRLPILDPRFKTATG